MNDSTDTIFAVASGTGGAVSLIRISGPDAIAVADRVFRSATGRKLSGQGGYTLHYGVIVDPEERDTSVDDVIVSLFRSPRSYTGEDMVEISCHGSVYIQRRIAGILIAQGARAAEPGEFTVRAFLGGKIDLSQAEAVADLIASTDRASHALAVNQMRGGYSAEFAVLREELLRLVSLLELELDFGEEDVTFADRSELETLLGQITQQVETLLQTFTLGNAVKEGVGVAIVGSPNVGKSTLLNALLKEDRAMVSDIPGTTRDVIEETLVIGGIRFRFIDTAGIRQTQDVLERMGIERTFSSIGKARIILLMIDAGACDRDYNSLLGEITRSATEIGPTPDQTLAVVLNKADKAGIDSVKGDDLAARLAAGTGYTVLSISAKTGWNLDALRDFLSGTVESDSLYDGSTIVSNTRHYEALRHAVEALRRASTSLRDGLPSDLLSQDIREVLHHIGKITGEITDDEILGTIFSKFCIGK